MPVVVFGAAWAFAPLPAWLSATCIALAVALGVRAAVWREHRRTAAGDRSGESTASAGADEGLDSAARELAVIVVVGPYAAALFPRDQRRSTLRRDDRAV
ncbi:hypothetical protein [Burkholderia dolosa]|nr:hypothetical protein [Burkholderia dolosa]